MGSTTPGQTYQVSKNSEIHGLLPARHKHPAAERHKRRVSAEHAGTGMDEGGDYGTRGGRHHQTGRGMLRAHHVALRRTHMHLAGGRMDTAGTTPCTRHHRGGSTLEPATYLRTYLPPHTGGKTARHTAGNSKRTPFAQRDISDKLARAHGRQIRTQTPNGTGSVPPSKHSGGEDNALRQRCGVLPHGHENAENENDNAGRTRWRDATQRLQSPAHVGTTGNAENGT